MSTNPHDGSQPSVVLVHGAWADGSGWRGVYDLLRQDGHEVRVVQNPTVSLQDDVAATKMIIGEQSDPVVLVGHSYGGTVITEAGNDPNVAALVYIAGWVPDAGESQENLIALVPSGVPSAGDLISAAAGRLPVARAGKDACIVRGRPGPMRARSWLIRRCRGDLKP